MECALDTSFVSDSSGEVMTGNVSILTSSEPNPTEDGDMFCDAKTVQDAKQKLLKYAVARPTLVVLQGNYTVKQFLKLFPTDSKENNWSKQRLLERRIYIFELPTKVHDAAAQSVVLQLRSLSRWVRSEGSGDIVLGNNTLLQPDGAIYVRGNAGMGGERPGAVDSRNNKLPKVVIEVSLTEPFSSIFALPAAYFRAAGEGRDDGIRGVVIVIVRREGGSQGGGLGRKQMVALYYAFGVNNDEGQPRPSAAISFGDYLHPSTKAAIMTHGRVPAGGLSGVQVDEDYVECDQAGLDQYKLEIPAAALLHGISPASQIAMQFDPNRPLFVDLYELKDDIIASSQD